MIDLSWERVRLLVLDVDGVLTDGGLWVAADGSVSKRFFVRDGSGIVRLQRAGTPVCWLTGRADPAVAARAKELGVTRLISGSRDKADALQSLALNMGVSLDEIAYVGDDLLDLPAIRLAGISVAPSDADEAVRAEVDLVSSIAGGQGVVRWVCDRLIAAKKEA
jgi:3-deoxy-D-manno-octulosonate 8-phosphate phosphatase (KDO 8-P phosphatase)